ncbi:MAG: glycoside hydrolase family 3 N-terminal domain-containing protein, partial [Actinomycetes bacterium]
IRLNYAPVADVNTNPFNAADGARTFGDRTKPVSKFVSAAVTGQRAYRTAVSAKHFPGLGSVSANTDFSVAISNQTKRQFQTIDFPPFQAAIAAKADSIMTSHMIAPHLDPTQTPASLSKPIVTGILRKQLGFGGVIITDTLDAKALAQWTSGQLALKAFKAGNDMLMMSINLQEAIDTLKTAVRSGKITPKRLNDSVRRILQMKLNSGVLDNPWAASPAAIAATVGSPAHLNTMQTVTNKGTTLIARSTAGAPLHAGSNVLLVGFGASTLPAVGALMTSAGANVQQLVTGSNPQLADISAAVTAAAGKDLVVVQTYNAWSSIGQQNLIAALRGTGVPLVMAIMAAPYDAALAPDARAVVAVYSYQRPCQVALVNVLFGQQPLGKLPVTVRNLTDQSQVVFPYGTGLRWN